MRTLLIPIPLLCATTACNLVPDAEAQPTSQPVGTDMMITCPVESWVPADIMSVPPQGTTWCDTDADCAIHTVQHCCGTYYVSVPLGAQHCYGDATGDATCRAMCQNRPVGETAPAPTATCVQNACTLDGSSAVVLDDPYPM